MRKSLVYSSITIIVLIIIFIIYLSFYGIKTERFNNLIIDKIKTLNSKLSLDINDVYLKLNIREKSINISTNNSKIYFDKESINLLKINLNLNILKFLKKENSIEKIEISTEKNKIKNVTNFINNYKFSIPRLIFFNQIKDGFIQANVNIIFKQGDQKNVEYNLTGKVSEVQLNILNNILIKDINFNFDLKNKKFSIKKPNFNYQEVNFYSEEIFVENVKNNYQVKGDLANKEGLLDFKIFSKIFNFNLDFLEKNKILAKTYNKFKFNINSNRKIEDLDLSSKIHFKEIFTDKKIQNLISFQDVTINTNYKKKKLNINIDSGYNFLNKEYKNNKNDKINVKILREKKEDFKIEVFIKNTNNSISSRELYNYIKYKKETIKDQNIIFGSDNRISFLINNKKEIKDLKIKSKLDLENAFINYKSSRLNKIFPNYRNIIGFKNTSIDMDFSENKINLIIVGDYSFKDDYDKFNFQISKNKNDFIFNSNLEIISSPVVINNINYKKKENDFSEVTLKGIFFENKNILFENISLSEQKNNFYLSNLYLSDKYKIINFKEIKVKYLNDDKKLNQLNIFKNKNIIKLSSNTFDGKSVIKNLLKGDPNNNFLRVFKNLNSKIILNFDHVFINDDDYLKKINGSLDIKKNKIKYGNISAKLEDKFDVNINIESNSKNEKVTNLIIDKPAPFIKYYKFIKGFNEGKLSYKSTEKNGLAKSNLKIFDFKVKEVPVLAKILTLASLQGIADLLTGEGIRFDDFEMDYETSKNSTNIKEMYAIGPAISILMSGYIEKNKLTSLRGTLVPATTINKTIAKIPLIGELLVGKKAGEGIFGVSFKIKGPPKDLKTTVNPIKTLTPRFITRTLEKLKKN